MSLSAVQEQVLNDNLQIMDGGYITLRGGRYVVCPRCSNQHVIDTACVFQAVEAGYAYVRDRHVHLTPAGYSRLGAL